MEHICPYCPLYTWAINYIWTNLEKQELGYKSIAEEISNKDLVYLPSPGLVSPLLKMCHALHRCPPQSRFCFFTAGIVKSSLNLKGRAW